MSYPHKALQKRLSHLTPSCRVSREAGGRRVSGGRRSGGGGQPGAAAGPLPRVPLPPRPGPLLLEELRAPTPAL